MEQIFTARNAAKFVVKAIVQSKATEIAKDTITDYTQFEEDDMTVKISCNVFGWYVSDKLKPYTDKMVDETADFIAKKRAERATKKEAEEQK